MIATFEKKQIISSTELVRSFKKYENELPLRDIFIFKHNAPEAVLMDYSRYEKIKERLEGLEGLLEHIAIYETVQQRKSSPTKKLSLGKLQKRYGL